METTALVALVPANARLRSLVLQPEQEAATPAPSPTPPPLKEEAPASGPHASRRTSTCGARASTARAAATCFAMRPRRRCWRARSWATPTSTPPRCTHKLKAVYESFHPSARAASARLRQCPRPCCSSSPARPRKRQMVSCTEHRADHRDRHQGRAPCPVTRPEEEGAHATQQQPVPEGDQDHRVWWVARSELMGVNFRHVRAGEEAQDAHHRRVACSA